MKLLILELQQYIPGLDIEEVHVGMGFDPLPYVELSVVVSGSGDFDIGALPDGMEFVGTEPGDDCLELQFIMHPGQVSTGILTALLAALNQNLEDMNREIKLH